MNSFFNGKRYCISLALHETTSSKKFECFLTILIYLNLFKYLHNLLLIQKKGYAFNVDIEYEILIYFVLFMIIIGEKET